MTPANNTPDPNAEIIPDTEKMAQALRMILDYMIGDTTKGKINVDKVGRRTLAFAWVLNPDLLNGRSLASISRDLGDKTRRPLSNIAVDCSRLFAVANRAQHQHAKRLARTHGGSSPLAPESPQNASRCSAEPELASAGESLSDRNVAQTATIV